MEGSLVHLPFNIVIDPNAEPSSVEGVLEVQDILVYPNPLPIN